MRAKQSLSLLTAIILSGCAAAGPHPAMDYLDGYDVSGLGDSTRGGSYLVNKRSSRIDFSDEAISGELTRPEGASLGHRIAARDPAKNPNAADPASTNAENKPDISDSQSAAAKRQVIYTGTLAVVVQHKETAMQEFLTYVAAHQGYMQSQTEDALVVRIPAAGFGAAVAKASQLGRLFKKEINAQDVTQQVFESALRITNMKKSRARLLEILKDAKKTSDILEIERELNRLTTELELLEGQLRNLKDQIAFSTLTLELIANAQEEQSQRPKVSPFPWISQLGAQSLLNRGFSQWGGRGWSTPEFSPPSKFVTFQSNADSLFAISADEVRVAFSRQVVEGGDLEFWKTALRKDFSENRSYEIEAVSEIQDKNEQKGAEILVQTRRQGMLYRYVVFMFLDQDWLAGSQLRVIESVGPAELMQSHLDELRQAVKASGR